MKAGDVDPSIINNFSSSLGQQVVSPKLIDRYTDKEVRTTLVDDTTEKQKYYLKIILMYSFIIEMKNLSLIIQNFFYLKVKHIQEL